MNHKNDDPVNIPSMKIDRDDVRSTTPSTSIEKPVSKKTESASKTATSTSSSGGWLSMSVAVVGTLVSLGLAFVVYQQQGQLQQIEGQLTDAGISISDNNALITQLTDDVTESNDWSKDQIRKLWGISYDRNKKAIASNTTAIARLESSLATTSKKLTKAQRDAGARGTAVERLQSELARKDILVSEANERALLLGEIIEEQQVQLQDMADNISKLERKNALMKSEINKRIKTTEDAMKSFDAYRKGVNRQLNELRGQINQAPAQ